MQVYGNLIVIEWDPSFGEVSNLIHMLLAIFDVFLL